ncbi:LCP family protein [Frankia sp. AgB1.9]|uniref:LCP family protein n=1 Tax=unclassified Frankia TaxID=2632575 RepID=UPI00193369C2|nr:MULTISPECIES: LCP family protein [unclassified Frankia]MBL7488642.1 LCP family protein [Frankia sp. AgW1.1]MBL7549161.1 LCP family protein [Frankia sp. AgB1.9]MBL7619155.1 LCP family protein [Frankia sp. AgB1.8]
MSYPTTLPPHLSPREDGGQGRRERGGGRRALRILLGFVSVVVLLISVGGWAQYTYANGNVHHISLNLGGNRPDKTFGVSNYLLVGTDSRAGSGDAYGGSQVLGQRSDSTILIHLAKDGSTTMVSFPRDTLVTIPAYTDGKGKHHAAHRDKFNSAISDGGPTLLVSLVEGLTGMRVDHYVSMDLAGFKQITNAIGGVDVCVLPSSFREYVEEDHKYSTNTNDPMSGWLGGPGTVHVNGDQALAFVRQRHGLSTQGDLDRIHRQQQFMGAVFRKASSSDILTNPIKLESLISAATSALTLDDNTSITDLKGLALSMKGVASGSMHVETLPTHPPTVAEGGNPKDGTLAPFGAVQIYNPVDLARIVVPLGGHVVGVTLDDTAAPSTPDPGATPGPVTVPPAQVSVAVYNGSMTKGLASKVTTALVGKGFQATTAGNADALTYTTSRVIYGTGQQQAAWTVQAAVPGSIARLDASVKGIHLILGAQYTGVVTPTAAGSGTTPAAAPTTQAPQGPPAPPNCTI